MDFVRVTGLEVDDELRVQTAQTVGFGDEVDGGDAEQSDEAEVLQPAGFASRPAITDTLEGFAVMRGDEPVVLVLVDKGAPAQELEAGETRMHGVNGSTNSATVIRIRANGDVDITAKSARDINLSVSGGGSVNLSASGGGDINLNVSGGGDVVLAGGSLKVARVTDAVDPSAGMATWMSQVAAAVNILAPGSVTPASPLTFATIASGGGATNVKA